MKIKEVQRTATFAWTRDTAANTLVTGTASGAIDADFNSNTQLEIWRTDKADPVYSTEVDARFHDLAVSHDNQFVAGAMENGVVNLWKHKGDSLESAGSGSNHKGAARAVAFNAENKLVSAGNNGEVFVWDVADMKGAAPGSSSRQDDIVGVAWNNRVNQILATAGTGGFTSIWDLRKRREVIHLHYTVAGSRLPTSSVSWHTANSTKLVTASSDDQNPVVLVWDLRNANSPETVLTGHSAGVLSVDWCQHDPSLLLSSGKDNRTLLWDPTSQEMLGEYPISVGWTFKTRFNPRVPDIFASASFDGKVTVQTLQDTSEPKSSQTNKASGDAFWDSEEVADAVHPQFHIHKAPSWLKRPISASFGFGGKLVVASGSSVKITSVKTSATDASALKAAFESKDYSSLISRKDDGDWKLLKQMVDNVPLFDDDKEAENKQDEDEFDIPSVYNPSGKYQLLDGKNDKIVKLVLSGNISKAVDILIEEGEHGDALLLASYDPELLNKARNAYLETSSKPYLRAAWARKNNLADFENVELDAWGSVLRLIHSDSSKTAALGKRLQEAGKRDDALRTYLAGGNISQAGEIWLKDLPILEKRYIDEKQTAYQAHAKALQDVIEKITVASKSVAVPDASAAINDAYRDFADIVASQGDLDLASALLDLLPTSYSQEKERISGATKSKKTPQTPARTKTSKYAQPPLSGFNSPAIPRPGAPSIPAPTASPVHAPAVLAGVGAPRSNPYAAPASTPATNPYSLPTPSANGAAANPYAANGAAATVPAAPNSGSTIAPPPKSGNTRVSTTIRPPAQGWNDLPEASIQNIMKTRRTPTAPPIIPVQVDPRRVSTPPRVPSAGPTPPPKTGGPRTSSSASSTPAPPASQPPKANPYAPAPGTKPSPYAPPAASVPAMNTPVVVPTAANPYAPPPGAVNPTPVAPKAAAAAPPPPPGKARSSVPPPSAASVAASLPVTSNAVAQTAATTSATPKYRSGDREHIPTDAQPIYANLSKTLERIRPTITAQFPKQMKDTERRVNILFDHLNNQDLLTPEGTAKLVKLSNALEARDYDNAVRIQEDLATAHQEELGQWIVGVKRLVQMASALPE